MLKVEDLLLEIADVPPVAGDRHKALVSAAAKVGVDITTAYRWIRDGMAKAKLAHVMALVHAVNADRDGRRDTGHANVPANLTIADVVGLTAAQDEVTP